MTSLDLDIITSNIFRVLAALSLAISAMIISRWQHLDLERDMLIAVIRAFFQLLAIGFVLEFIFAADRAFWIILIIFMMILVAGYTAGRRANLVPNSQKIATVAVTVGAVLTLGILITLGVFPFEARYVIPIAGMIVGNSMIVTGLVMTRLRDDLKLQRPQIEAALALGATPRQASIDQMRRAMATGMTPIIDNTKTVGLISLPGAMTGMILAGVSPLEAVQIQIIVMYMLMGAAAFSGLTAAFLSQPQFFTSSYQLVSSALIDQR